MSGSIASTTLARTSARSLTELMFQVAMRTVQLTVPGTRRLAAREAAALPNASNKASDSG